MANITLDMACDRLIKQIKQLDKAEQIKTKWSQMAQPKRKILVCKK